MAAVLWWVWFEGGGDAVQVEEGNGTGGQWGVGSGQQGAARDGPSIRSADGGLTRDERMDRGGRRCDTCVQGTDVCTQGEEWQGAFDTTQGERNGDGANGSQAGSWME
jgi:hypothetical protein